MAAYRARNHVREMRPRPGHVRGRPLLRCCFRLIFERGFGGISALALGGARGRWGKTLPHPPYVASWLNYTQLRSRRQRTKPDFSMLRPNFIVYSKPKIYSVEGYCFFCQCGSSYT